MADEHDPDSGLPRENMNEQDPRAADRAEDAARLIEQQRPKVITDLLAVDDSGTVANYIRRLERTAVDAEREAVERLRLNPTDHLPHTVRALLTERQSLMELVQALEQEQDDARTLVAEANNSLYGSQGYFHSLNGGEFYKYHLADGIEKLKRQANSEYQRAESAEALTVSLRAELEAQKVLSDNLFVQVQQLQMEKATCPDHGPHVGFWYCPECYQRAFTAGQEAALAASSPKEPRT